MKTDILIIISFNLNDPTQRTIKTNAEPEAIEDLLATWIQAQSGSGKDTSNPNIKDIYEVQISLDLSDDTFSTRSDTGNKGLTAGIVIRTFQELSTIQILPLS